MSRNRKLLAAVSLASLIWANAADAAVTTITFLDASSASHNGAFTTDSGSGDALALGAICGGAAATMGTACTVQWELGAAGQGRVEMLSGDVALGAFADGAIITMGTEADTAWSGSGSGTAIAILKAIAGGVTGPIPLGTNPIGTVDPTTAANWGIGSTGSTVPTKAQYIGAMSNGSLTGIIQADNSAAINITSATTTQVVPLSSGKKTYILGWDVISAGTGTVQLEYGTGTNCSTVVGTLTGAYPLAANGGLVRPSGLGPALIVPASVEVCVVTTSSATAQGSISYTQF